MTDPKRSLLMVHGLSGSAKVWDRFAPFFSEQYDIHPITLFPELRTKKAPPIELADLDLDDYFDHVAEIAKSLTEKCNGKRPIIIGHSFGGLIAQKLAEQGHVSAAVFLTSAAPADCFVTKLSVYISLWSIAKAPQHHWIGRSYKLQGSSFRWGLLHNIPEFKHKDILQEMRYDSGRMIHQLVNSPPEIEEKQVFVPTLTIGAAKDRITPVQGSRKMAEKYRWAGSRGDYLEYPDASHWIVDEDGTEKVTEDIHAWLQRRLPQ